MTTKDFDRSDSFAETWLLGKDGGRRKLSREEFDDYSPTEGEWLWLHLNYSEPGVKKWLRKSSGVPDLAARALLQADIRPRCVPVDSGLMLFLRGINLNPGAAPDDMVSIRIWIDGQRIISLAQHHLQTVDDMSEAMQQGVDLEKPGDFLTMFVNRLLNRANTVVEDLSDTIDELEGAVIDLEDPGLREQLSDVRRQAITLRRFLAPQREALNRLVIEKTSILSDNQRLYLREDSDRLTRLIEELDADRERAGVIHESLLSRIAEQTNQRMYVLSIIAAIFLPLSFVTGLLGVNVGGIPGMNNELGFSFVILLMLFLAGALWAFFHWRRWF